MSIATELRYDPYDREIEVDPYPIFRQLRDESPLYYNDQYDFYALSRFDDVERGLKDTATLSSTHGVLLDMVKANLEFPNGVFIFEDPPVHTAHRSIVSRVFTPGRMNELEAQVRAFCADALDPLVDGGTFDFVTDLGGVMPLRVIGMLLGIPDQDQIAAAQHGNERTRREPGKAKTYDSHNLADDTFFGDYIDWRAEHPSDDLMSELLQAEFEDETGTTRRLSREEVLTFVNVLTTAGNETTNRLIGWTGKVLSEHPDQRRELADDRTLLPGAVEELLRFEPPVPQLCRYVTTDTLYHGTTVPEGSAMLLLGGSACRDQRAFGADADEFDIHRTPRRHLAFGVGAHYCVGAALARLEGRVALDEVLNRFPDWEVDLDRAEFGATAVRGFATLPASTP